MYVDSKNTNAGPSSGLVTATAPSYSVNDILIGLFSLDGADTLGFPSGWTKVRQDSVTNGDTQTVGWGWIKALGGDSFDFTNSAGHNVDICIASYSGRDGTTPIDVSSNNNPNLSSVPTSPVTITCTGITTSVPGCDIVALGAIDSNGQSGTFTESGSLNKRIQTFPTNFQFGGTVIADFNQGSAGATGDQIITWASAGEQGNFVSYLISLLPAGVSPTPNQSNFRFYLQDNYP